MLENLEKWMNINDNHNEELLEGGKIIEKNPDIKLEIFTQKGSILYYFQELVKGNIELKDFFYIGDSTGEYNTIVEKMYTGNIDAISYIKTKKEMNPNYIKGKLFILDSSLKQNNLEDINILYI